MLGSKMTEDVTMDDVDRVSVDGLASVDGSTGDEQLLVTAIEDDDDKRSESDVDTGAQELSVNNILRRNVDLNGAQQTETGVTSPISALPSSGAPTRENSPVLTNLAQGKPVTEDHTVYKATVDGTPVPEAPHPFWGDVFNSLDYPYSNIALIEYADPAPSTSTAIFHFTVDPPKELPESFIRPKLDGDTEIDIVSDTDFGYHATPEEVEATRKRAVEKAKQRAAERALAEEARLKAEQRMLASKQKRKYTKRAAVTSVASSVAGAENVVDATLGSTRAATHAANVVNSVTNDKDGVSVDGTTSRQASPVDSRKQSPVDDNRKLTTDDNRKQPPVEIRSSKRRRLRSRYDQEGAMADVKSDHSDADDEQEDEDKTSRLRAVPMSATPSAAESAVSTGFEDKQSPAVDQTASSIEPVAVAVSGPTAASALAQVPPIASTSQANVNGDEPKSQSPETSRSPENARSGSLDATETAGSANAHGSARRTRQLRFPDKPTVAGVRLKLTGAHGDSSKAMESRLPDIPVDQPLGPGESLIVQDQSCRHKTFAKALPCHACLNNEDEGDCAFNGLRTFRVNSDGEVVDRGHLISSVLPDQPLQIKDVSEFTGVLSESGANWNRAGVVRPLIDRLETSLKVLGKTPVRVSRRADQSYVCDTCLRTTMFVRHVCERCGRFACHSCIKQLEQLCNREADADTQVDLAALRSAYSHDTNRRLRCLSQRKTLMYTAGEMHQPSSFKVVTSFDARELENLLGQAKEFVRNGLEPKLESDDSAQRNAVLVVEARADPAVDKLTGLWRAFKREKAALIKNNPLTDFDTWTAPRFEKLFADDFVRLKNPRSVDAFDASGEQFFQWWGHDRHDTRAWKMEYFDALPEDLRDVLQLNGKANLLAQSPEGVTPPLTQPRFCFSLAEKSAASPSTNLQVAHADYSNLLFRSTEKRSAAWVKWTIYPPSVVDKVRGPVVTQMARKLKVNAAKYAEGHDDPLFMGNGYWSPANVQLLDQQTGIKPYEVMQRVGDLVLIPAGSAYQTTTNGDILSLEHYFLTSASVDNVLDVHEEARRQVNTNALTFDDELQVELQLFWTWLTAQDRYPLPEPAQESAQMQIEPRASTPPPQIVGDDDATTKAVKKKRKSIVPSDHAYKGKK
ncbi:hypothetical protein OIO90_000900 [Microbotryomycetes sp. JL221]|nr:hypothetical protein OIO90_000900 [Microbotryomycetes sp. JL221]